MKRFITDAAVVAIGLAGLVLSHVVVSPASVAVPVSVSDADKAAALHATGADYANSLFRGDSLNVMGHLSDFCSDSEQGEAGYATELIVRKAKGATLTVTSVTVDGDRGSVSGYELSAGAPAALRELLSSAQASAASYPWRFVDGQWYFQGGCGVAPSAFATPVRTSASIF